MQPADYAEQLVEELGEDGALAVSDAIRDLTGADEVHDPHADVEPSPAEVWAERKARERRNADKGNA